MTHDEIIERLIAIQHIHEGMSAECDMAIDDLVEDLKKAKDDVKKENAKWTEDGWLKEPWYMEKQEITPEQQAELFKRFPSLRKFMESKNDRK